MADLWGFSKLNKNDLQGTPHGILKEQAELFDKKTDDVLYARLKNRKLSLQVNETYHFATNFEIVAPNLDGYSYTLLTLFSMPEKDYPVAINYNANDKEDWELGDFDYTCDNEEQFLKQIEIILQSPETMDVIRNLYSKSSY